MSEITFYSAMYQAVPHLLEIQRRTGGEFVTSRRSTATAIKRIHGIDVHLLKKGDLEGQRLDSPFASTGLLVTGSPYERLLGNLKVVKVMTFHGTYMDITRETALSLRHFDFLCMIGPRMRDMLSRHVELLSERQITGYLPFSSFPASENRGELKRRVLVQLGMDPSFPVVLYTPTSSPTGSLQHVLPIILKELPKDINLIVRPHPRDVIKNSISRFARNVWLATQCRLRKNTIFEKSWLPLPELQAVSDLLISDGNSPSEDILFYETPQIIINPVTIDAAAKRMQDDGFHADDIERQLMFQFGMPSYQPRKKSFFAVFEQALAGDKTYEEIGRNHFSWVFGSRSTNAAENVSTQLKKLQSKIGLA